MLSSRNFLRTTPSITCQYSGVPLVYAPSPLTDRPTSCTAFVAAGVDNGHVALTSQTHRRTLRTAIAATGARRGGEMTHSARAPPPDCHHWACWLLERGEERT